MTETHSRTPQIYVACLASYNSGELHGDWIDAAQDVRDLHTDILKMLKESPIENAEEWAIHDYEDFHPLSVGEYEDLELISAAANLIAEHRSAAAGILEHFGGLEYHEDAKRLLEDGQAGTWESVEDWAGSLVDEGIFGEVSKGLLPYIDLERLARDLELSGDIVSIRTEEGVAIFWNR